tara:strand:+ start:1737 stop:2747 length:1011 start_codon:yes stop_codon:yes gene_type:complete
MNREFLKEAISDAKTMKESAIANAKVALEEAFSPQLHAMFASKIEEMDKEEMDEGYDEMDEAKMSDPDMRHGLKGDNTAEKETEEMREEEDLDLDEILAELEGDLNEDARTDAEEIGYLDGMKDEKEDMDMDDEDIDIEDMSEDDLKDFIEDVIADMVASGELEAGEGAEMEDEESEDEDIDIEVEDDEEVTIDENARTDAEEEGYKDGMKDEKEDLKDDLKEAMKTVATLRSELNEINLLNSKLLYANKIFKATNMTESQKAKVLSAFDKAATVNEVKIVFSTISDNTTFTKKTIKEGVRGSASKPMHTPKVTKKKPIVESDEMVSRFKKLAGII